MEELQAYIDKFKEALGELDRKKQMAIGGGAGLLLILVIYFSFSGSKGGGAEYLPLYSDIDMKEAGELTSRLREMNQDFKIGGDGSIVLVPEESRLMLRNALAVEGFPKTGFIGYEVFDEVPLGMTEFLQEVKHQQALEGELKRTIMQLQQIEDVRLHVVMPKPSLFSDSEKPATASILLNLRQNMRLSRAQIQGIQRLVASSVEGLDPNRITVVDNAGNMLSEEMDPLARVTAKQLEIQRDVESYLETRTQSILDRVLGPDQAFVRVSAELDFDQHEEEVKTYDPDQTVTRSEQRSEESSAEAGTKENIVSNFEINSSIRRITGSVGGLKRVTAALMINGEKPVIGLEPGSEPQFEPRTEDDFNNIAKIARGALGLDESVGGRGDFLTISAFQFATQDLKRAAAKEQSDEETKELILTIVFQVAKGIAIVIALLILRAIIGAIGRGVAREEEIAMEAQREIEEDDAGEELPETPHEIILGRIAQLISDRPEDAAKLIRTMLIEESQRDRGNG
ncbi:MAG: flagellar basal-body MS-ring/collar protein FliF [Candidatus Latescibacterota bacterium]|nr:flagellar basal-body MS-ring/collar protein FliF [Candidatus Latescibacterota bacterium]